MPISTLGTIGLLILFFVCLATIGLAVVGAHRRSPRLVEASIQGTYAIAALAAFCSALIVYAFVASDFSIQYVQHTSDTAMPLFFKITSFWGGLDGSLLFWVLLLAIFSALAVRANRARHPEMIPWVVAILAASNLFFIALCVFLKNPFEPFLIDAPTEGRGLNPLLQNAYMIIHPPSLYLGYVSLAVPYAFGMAAVITGQVDATWQASVRRWTLFSWMFLSVGLILGGLWAYEELGWGGYWAWDPVENAGLFPWFTCTAFLHSIMIQERRGMLKIWNVLLVIFSFLLSIFGTFLTRSGVVQSVHAFGKDTDLAWAFGAFMIVILVGSVGVVIWRARLLKAKTEMESLLSREFAFVVNNWLLVAMAMFVVGATMYPTITEFFADKVPAVCDTFGGPLRDGFGCKRVTIGPPFFNRVMVPLGLALIMLTGIGPLLAWRKTSTKSLVKQFAIPLASGVLAMLVVLGLRVLTFQAMFDPAVPGSATSPDAWRLASLDIQKDVVYGLACFGLVGFTSATIFQEFVRGIAVARKGKDDVSIVEAAIRLITRARRRYGGYIVHLGVVLMFLGWAGNSYKIEKKVNLRPGDAVSIGDCAGAQRERGTGCYIINHAGLRATEDWQKEMITADIEVVTGGGLVEHELPSGEVVSTLEGGRVKKTLHPARWWYFQLPEQPTTEVARHMNIGSDVYVSIQTVDMTTGWTQMRLFINPLVNWIWIGTLVLLLGGLICIGTKRKEKVAADV